MGSLHHLSICVLRPVPPNEPRFTFGTSFSIANAKYGSRNIIPITGGTTTGRVKGKILNGGADYQLSGSLLDAWYTLAPDNGEFILVRNTAALTAL